MNSQLMVNGVRTAVRHAGEGPAIVMLHGMACDSACWQFTMEALQDEYRVIAPDLPGHGDSQADAFPYSLAFYTAWLHSLLNALELEQATLMGNSMGGAVALNYARQHPERVSQIVLANPLGVSRHIPWDSGWRMLQRAPHALRLMLTGKADPHLRRYLAGSVVKHPTTPIMRVLSHIAERNILWMLWAGLRLLLVDFFPSRKRRAFARRLGDINVPVLIAWGRFDGVLPVRNATEAKALMPSARVRVFGDSAHMPMLEEPDAFEQLVREFLHRNRRTHDQPRHAQPVIQRGRAASD